MAQIGTQAGITEEQLSAVERATETGRYTALPHELARALVDEVRSLRLRDSVCDSQAAKDLAQVARRLASERADKAEAEMRRLRGEILESWGACRDAIDHHPMPPDVLEQFRAMEKAMRLLARRCGIPIPKEQTP